MATFQPKCVVCVSGSHIMPLKGSLADVYAALQQWETQFFHYITQTAHVNDELITIVILSMPRNVDKTRYDEKMRIIWRDLLPIPDDPSKKVEVWKWSIFCVILFTIKCRACSSCSGFCFHQMGKIKCPVLFIAGEDDQNWPAPESAADVSQSVWYIKCLYFALSFNLRPVMMLKSNPQIKKMMEKAGNGHLLTVLSYPGTGHLIEPPYSPHVRFSDFKLLEAKTKG